MTRDVISFTIFIIAFDAQKRQIGAIQTCRLTFHCRVAQLSKLNLCQAMLTRVNYNQLRKQKRGKQLEYCLLRCPPPSTHTLVPACQRRLQSRVTPTLTYVNVASTSFASHSRLAYHVMTCWHDVIARLAIKAGQRSPLKTSCIFERKHNSINRTTTV